MTDTPHTLLVADGASRFADEIGFPRCEASDLVAAAQDRNAAPTADTVGALALDRGGNLAAASSTGGIPRKLPGRVGDSPLVGCGAYADNTTAAATATGDGEALMKLVISKHACDAIGRGEAPQSACEAAVALLTERLHAMGGLIALDAQGRIGIAFNAEAMPYAYATGDAAMTVSHSPP
jgi:beta-aspartyl-peptidase (threonine type)